MKKQGSHKCIDSKYIVQIRSAALFDGPIRKALHNLKYHYDPSFAWELIRIVYPLFPIQDWKIDFIVPVPLGKKREELRGYNQSNLLSQALSMLTGFPTENRVLFRIRETRSQVGLSNLQRKENIRDAFKASPVIGKRILLIDDVCTTGSTMESGAKALRESGAVAVFGISIARAVPIYLLGD
jgi:ComF family protein